MFMWLYVAQVVSILAVASYHCIILHCTSFVDAAVYLPRPYRYNIVRCPRRGTMQLHTLLDMEAVGMAFALHLHSLWFFIFQICIGMNVVVRT
jgi:hypothetical protein